MESMVQQERVKKKEEEGEEVEEEGAFFLLMKRLGHFGYFKFVYDMTSLQCMIRHVQDRIPILAYVVKYLDSINFNDIIKTN